MSESKNYISTAELEQEFDQILLDETNRRIILSGIFGIGKTTFIRKFFESRTGKFVSIKIFPVNYSVATNEDIFELLKYDIFYELLQKNPEFEKVDVTWFEALGFLTKKDIKPLMADFVGLIPKIGKTISEVSGAITKIARTLESKVKDIAKDDLNDILKFARGVENTSGGIYENDFYSQLIESLIQSLREPRDETEERKQIVLVIDDLDRIDPEHIFRILNVFAAHFDVDSGANKFKIDKVVLCCDVENVRKIFRNKYGVGVDFNGYVDKFFSKNIFYFRNNKNIKDAVPKLLNTIEADEVNYLFGNHNWFLGKFVISILERAADLNRLNLRMLTKYVNSVYVFPRRKIKTNRPEGFPIRNIPIVMTIEFLTDILGGEQNLIELFSEINFATSLKEHEDKLILGNFILLADWRGVLLDQFTSNQNRSFMHDSVKIDYMVYSEVRKDRVIEYGAVFQSVQDRILDARVQNELILKAVKNYFGLLRT